MLALARPRLGRGPRGRRPARAVPPERARWTSTRDVARAAARVAATPTTATAPTTRSRRAASAGGLARRRATTASAASSTDEQVAAFRGRGAQPGACGSGCPTARLTWDDLVRGEITFEPEHVPDFALVPRQRRPALHAGQPGRRRADGDHPRAARRGPAVEHPAPARAVRRAGRSSASAQGDAAVRPPALRDGRGQQEAVQARPAGPPARLPRRRASCPRACSTTSRCSAGRSAATATCSRIDEMVAAFDIGDVNPNPARFDLKKAEAINADHMRMLSTSTTSPTGCSRSSRRPASSATRCTTPTRSSSSWRCRWSPSG